MNKEIRGIPLKKWMVIVLLITIAFLLTIGLSKPAKAGFVLNRVKAGPTPHSLGEGGTNWTRVYNNSDATTTTLYAMAKYNNQLYIGIGTRVKRYNGSSWTQINKTGFGDSGTWYVSSMAVFDGLLYVGTNNPDTGAEVWSYNGSVWSQANKDGFNESGLYACQALEVYNNNLYAIVSSNGGKFRVYKYSGSSTSWTRVDTGAWDFNNHVGLCATSFDSKLWIGSKNTSTGTEIWCYNGLDWKQVNTDGFGKTDLECPSLAVYKDHLYAGTDNSPTRAKVCRYNGGKSWTQVNQNGFGNNYNYSVSSLASYGDKLFAGTRRLNSEPGCQIWSYDSTHWNQENTNGFGNSNNTEATSMAVFNSHLYVGTNNFSGAQVWRSAGTQSPPTPYAVYLPEGSTDYGFSEYISIENPNPNPVTVKLTYQTKDGPVGGPQFQMPAKSQATVNPADTLSANDFSTKVECLNGKLIAADRTMTWTGPGAASPEAHNSIGVTAPAKTWYLPEGSSEWGFECWLLIQNPNSVEASCDVTYMIEGRGPVTVNKKVPANSRKTFFMTDDIGSADASIKVVSNLPVIPERAMYRNNRREGHDSIGTTAPAQDYFLAEGTSAWGFTTYVLVQNPNDTANKVTVTYMTNDGPKAMAPFEMPPNSRKTIRVNDVLPNVDFSTEVHGSQPIIAERAMYWNNGTGEACHDSIGMNQPHTTFYLPDGQTSNGQETWTLVQNPNSSLVEVEISYLMPNGAGNVVFTDTIPANSRRTYNMADKGIGGRAAIMVKSLTSGKKIMAERAMYWNSRGTGTDTIGGFSD